MAVSKGGSLLGGGGVVARMARDYKTRRTDKVSRGDGTGFHRRRRRSSPSPVKREPKVSGEIIQTARNPSQGSKPRAGDPHLDATVTPLSSLPILLHGGGIDSSAVFLLLVHSGTPFKVLHVNYCQPSFEEEFKAIFEQCHRHKVPLESIFMPPPPRGKELVKGRNAALLSLAFTRTNTVYAGLIRDCLFADSSAPFVDAYRAMLQTYNPTARLLLPTYELHKGQELALILILGGKDFPYWTCNTPKVPFKPCGKCGHCVDEASWKANLKDVGKLLKWYPYAKSKLKVEKDESL